MELERCVAEAQEAGNAATLSYGKRLSEAVARLGQLRTAAASGQLLSSPAAGGPLGVAAPLSPAPTAAAASFNSHRSPSPQKESPLERTLRKQRLASKMGKKR